MRISIIIIISCIFITTSHAQDVNALLKEAANLEKQFDEPAALEKYKLVVAAESKNLFALVKCAELYCSIGARQLDKFRKRNLFTAADEYDKNALAIDSNNAQANYAKALAETKMAEIEPDGKQIVEHIRAIKMYVDKALSADKNLARANNILGKWHYNMLALSWIKKSAVKVFYDVLPDAEIDSAILYFQKCKALDQYFVQNYLDLARAYQYNNEPAKAIETLNSMIRLPVRTADDTALKEEARKQLQALQ